MHILSIGLNHTTTPVELRERLTFSEDQVRAALARSGCGHANITNELKEMVIISTCNCIEIYVASTYKSFSGLEAFLSDARGVSVDDLRPHLYYFAGAEAVRHLLDVAAGLCERSVHDIKTAQIVILGAGEMAELAVEALRKRGAAKLMVVNRTLDRAHTLADRWNAEADTFENLELALVRADILIASTGAPHTVIHSEMVNSAMFQRPERPLMLVDIVVPRDIDSEVAKIPTVRLHDIDNLNAHLEQSLAERASEVPYVETILDEEESKFLDFLASLEMLPLIVDMRQQAETIRQAELNKTLHRLPDLNEADRDRIEALTQALVKKLLDAPTNRLRAQANKPNAPEVASVAHTLFGLSASD